MTNQEPRWESLSDDSKETIVKLVRDGAIQTYAEDDGSLFLDVTVWEDEQGRQHVNTPHLPDEPDVWSPVVNSMRWRWKKGAFGLLNRIYRVREFITESEQWEVAPDGTFERTILQARAMRYD